MSSSATAARSARWFLGLLTIFSVFGFGFGSWLGRLPAVRDRLGASTLEMSVIGLTLAAGSGTGLLLAGRTVSALGPKRTLVWSAFGQAIAMPLAGLLLWSGQDVLGMCALAAYGFCFSTGDVAMNVSGASAERAVGRSRMPMLHAGYSFGGVVAMGASALAEALAIPVPLHLGAVFVVVLGAALVALRAVPRDELAAAEAAVRERTAPRALNTNTGPIHYVDPSTIAAPGPEPARYSPWRDPRIVVIGLITLSLALGEGTATDWLPLALTDHRGFSNAAAATALGVFFISMMATRALGGPLIERFGRVWVLRGSAAFIAAAIILVNLVPGTWAGYACALLWGIGSALGFPIGVSAAADDPSKAVRGVATVSAIAYASYLIGPMAIGFIGEHFGLLTAFWPLLLFLVFAFCAAGAARDTRSGENP